MGSNKEVNPKSVSSIGSSRTVNLRLSTSLWVVLVIILVGLSFWGGVLYGSGMQSSANNLGLAASSKHSNFAVGMVVYISSTSITITNEENSFNQEFVISSKTLISINGVKASASQIKPGSIVLIQVNKTDQTKANVILANSHFSG